MSGADRLLAHLGAVQELLAPLADRPRHLEACSAAQRKLVEKLIDRLPHATLAGGNVIEQTAKHGQIMTAVQAAGFCDADADALMDKIALKAAQPAGPTDETAKYQDWTSMTNFLPEKVWQGLRVEGGVMAFFEFLAEMGLQTGSEPTMQTMAVILMLSCEGTQAAMAKTPVEKNQQVKVTKRWFTNYVKSHRCTPKFWHLPAVPADLRLQHPSLYDEIYKKYGPPVSCPLDPMAMQSMLQSTRMRGSAMCHYGAPGGASIIHRGSSSNPAGAGNNAVTWVELRGLLQELLPHARDPIPGMVIHGRDRMAELRELQPRATMPALPWHMPPPRDRADVATTMAGRRADISATGGGEDDADISATGGREDAADISATMAGMRAEAATGGCEYAVADAGARKKKKKRKSVDDVLGTLREASAASAAKKPKADPKASAAKTPTKALAKASAAKTPTKAPAKASAAKTPTKAGAKASAAKTPTKAPAKASAAKTPLKAGAKASAAKKTPTKAAAKASAAKIPTKAPELKHEPSRKQYVAKTNTGGPGTASCYSYGPDRRCANQAVARSMAANWLRKRCKELGIEVPSAAKIAPP